MNSKLSQQTRRIACLSLRSAEGPETGRIELGGVSYEWDVLRAEADLKQLHRLIEESLKRYDAVALSGLRASYRIGSETYQIPRLWEELKLADWGERFSDGAGLQSVLAPYLARQAIVQLASELNDKRLLLFSGITHFGIAELLRQHTKKITFGDLVFGLRLNLPIRGLKMFRRSVPRIINAIRRGPVDAFWRASRRRTEITRARFLLKRAQVLIGELPYFQRFASRDMDGRIVFSTLYSEEDADWFALRNVGTLVSLTPVVDGSYVPLSVLEAALRFGAVDSGVDLEDYFVARLRDIDLKPRIFNLSSEVERDRAMAAVPKSEPALLPAEDEFTPRLSGDATVAKFAFVIHPLQLEHAERLRLVRAARHIMPKRLLEDALAQVPPFPVGTLSQVTSATGARAEGLLYAVPMTSRALLRYPPEFLYKRLKQIADDAQREGCTLMGLGAFTSVVGDAGLTVSRQVQLGVTTGNSYTVAITLGTLKSAAERCGIVPKQAKLLIIGATGSIGSIAARLAAPEVAELLLVGPRSSRLLALARQLDVEHPGIGKRIRCSRSAAEFLAEADAVITTTSAVESVVDVSRLKPGCLVLDVARPPDITREVAARRSDILVVESGEVQLPKGSQLSFNIGLPPGVIYACFAETLLLALERHQGHFTLGREIEPSKVSRIDAIAAKHGFKAAPISSFGRSVSQEEFARLAEINLNR